MGESRFCVAEQVVRDDPFVAFVVAPELGAGHIEYAPIRPPFHRMFRAVCFTDQREKFRFVGVHVAQPGLRGFLVVLTVDLPVMFDAEVILEVKQ